jgi:hypothetical protein
MPRLVSDATTPQELREEIVSLLLQRAKQQTGLISTTGAEFLKQRYEHTAKVLCDLAGEVKCMELTQTSPENGAATPEEKAAVERFKTQRTVPWR